MHCLFKRLLAVRSVGREVPESGERRCLWELQAPGVGAEEQVLLERPDYALLPLPVSARSDSAQMAPAPREAPHRAPEESRGRRPAHARLTAGSQTGPATPARAPALGAAPRLGAGRRGQWLGGRAGGQAFRRRGRRRSRVYTGPARRARREPRRLLGAPSRPSRGDCAARGPASR